MEELKRHMGMSLYGDNEDPAYLMYSLGVSYRMSEDGIWFVKVPVEDGEAKREEAVIAVVEDEIPDHDEIPSEEIPSEALDELIEWYSS